MRITGRFVKDIAEVIADLALKGLFNVVNLLWKNLLIATGENSRASHFECEIWSDYSKR